MIRSMSTAVTGLRGHQQKLDVIGNNIANVNTVAFKKSQARFEDLLSQTIQGATAPLTRGGINPSQVGMGMRVSSIIDIHFQGSIMNTDRETDLAVEGEGFFVVSDGTREYYTRDGSFGRDSNGELVNANGLKVLGWRGAGMLQGSGELVPMYIPLGERMVARPSETLGFAGNLDARNFLAAQNEVQQINLGGATGGTFTLTYDGQTTVPLAFNATAAQVRAALANLSNLGANDIAVTGAAGSWSIEFTGSLEEQDIPLMTIDGSLLSGATGPAVFTTVEGEAGVDEVQLIDLDGASGGNFTLTFGANTTAAIAHNATAGQVQAALELLGTIGGAGNVAVSGVAGGPYEVTFTGALAGTDVAQMIITNTALLGAGSQTVTTTTPGVTGIADVYTYEYYVYDSLGRRYAVDFTFTPTAQNTWAYDLTVSDPGGTPVVLTGGNSGVLAFDDSGAFNPFASNIPNITFTPPGADP
ncbi:MAG: flagellar hook-basal body complex protein, partial [Dethiobacteria bacterium]|nr:flagellar hook-basal body complex protein [Dethiobacteria bacterium]